MTARRLFALSLAWLAACGGPRIIEVRSVVQPADTAHTGAGKPAVPARRVPPPVPDPASAESTYGRTFLRLSEPAGYFPSENVVSNETSYLHVLDAMRRLGVKGGAYIGVGPDQNFSYIAAIRPEVAFMFDIRRDAKAFREACRAQGVVIGRLFPPLLTHARVTVGTMDEMRRATDVFRRVLVTA